MGAEARLSSIGEYAQLTAMCRLPAVPYGAGLSRGDAMGSEVPERITELRVHGVSGNSAQDVLDRPLVHRVAGDSDAGFYRPRPEYGSTTGPGGARLEAYV